MKRLHYFYIGLSWLLVLLTLGVLLLIVAPYRGAPWSSDDALFLRMSWEAAHSYGWDQMLPQSPSYLFNAVWMRLGLTQLLQFRYLHIFFSFFCAFIFFGGLLKNPLSSVIFPATIALSIVVSINSIASPNSLALNFFMMSAGIFFLALRQVQYRQVSFGISALLLALCAFMHAGVTFACIFLALLMIWIVPQVRRTIFFSFFSLSLIALWVWYVNEIGIAVLLQTPAAHEAGMLILLNRIWLILKFALLPFVTSCLVFYCKYRYKKIRYPIDARLEAQALLYQLSWVATALAVLSMLSYLFGWSWRFPGWRGILQIPGLIYYPLFFYLTYLVQKIYIQTDFQSDGFKYKNIRLSCKRLLQCLSPQGQNIEQKKKLISVAGFLLLPAALAVGSNTAIIQGLVFFAGPAAGLMIFLWFDLRATGHHAFSEVSFRIAKRGAYSRSRLFFWSSWQILFLVWFTVFGAFALTYNHPASRKVLEGSLVEIKEGPLKGIYETERYRESLSQLSAVYHEQHCNEKTLIVLDYVPLLYFIYGHAAPNLIGVIRPMYYYPQEQIMNALTDSQGWCVIDITDLETQDDIQKNAGDRRDSLRQWLKMRGKKYDATTPDSEFVGNIEVYVK